MGGVGVIITSLEGDTLRYGVQLQFPTTNNESENKAILAGHKIAKTMGAKNMLLKSDSKLVIWQIKWDYEAKEQRMKRYQKLMKWLVRKLEQVEFMQVPCGRNSKLDEVAWHASSEIKTKPLGLMLEVQKFPSIKEFHTFSIQGNMSWITPIRSYPKDRQLPPDQKEVRKIKKQATKFTLLNDVLYKRGLSLPYLKCVEQDETKYILEEVHECVCGDHSGARSLVSKITKAGYF